MALSDSKKVLVLGANSDVARQMILIYAQRGHTVLAASRSTADLQLFVDANPICTGKVTVAYFDAVDYSSHDTFLKNLPWQPNIVVYAAGYLVDNLVALKDWKGTFQMMQVHYCGAVSILNRIVSDESNSGLEQIIGLSSLSGVRGRKSNFIYGSTKSAFTQYLAGLRQHLQARGVQVNVIVAGYIRSKMTAGLDLTESLMLEPAFIAQKSVDVGRRFISVPGWKWKIIYQILKRLPESMVAKLP